MIKKILSHTENSDQGLKKHYIDFFCTEDFRDKLDDSRVIIEPKDVVKGVHGTALKYTVALYLDSANQLFYDKDNKERYKIVCTIINENAYTLSSANKMENKRSTYRLDDIIINDKKGVELMPSNVTDAAILAVQAFSTQMESGKL